ncbi:MAG TPA: YciI family protein [Micropruina sp.]|nr:YciI family protein [Micropruina sp.]
MPDYLIYFNQQWVGDHSEDWFRSREKPSNAVVDEMKAAGVYVYAAGVEVNGPVYAADATSGEVVVTDGPYTDTPQRLGGFTIVSVADDEAAKHWAGKIAVGCGWPQEVRRIG